MILKMDFTGLMQICVSQYKIKKMEVQASRKEMIMLSGWLVVFKNNHKIILDEECYQEYDSTHDKKDVKCEAHWFSLLDLIQSDSLKEQEIKQRFIKEYNYKKLLDEGLKEK